MSDIFEDLDKQKFGWFHARSILTTGMGVFTDGYDLSSVGIVLAIILSAYGVTKSSSDYVLVTSLVAGSALVGAAVGALIFGELAKRGRKKFYGVDVLILGVAALMQVFAVNVWLLIAIRLILGIGVGADYVMSPMIMGEHSNAKDRGKTIGFGFGMMWGFGAILAAFTYMIFGPVLGVSDAILWRVVLAVGAIPALAVVYLRRKMPETPRFIARVAGDKKSFEQEVNYIAHKSVRIQGDIQDKHNFKYYFHKYRREYISAMVLWFFYDQVAYAGILFGPTLIAKKMGLSPDAWTYLMEVFTIAGGIVMLALIDRKGRKMLQVTGFIGMGAFLLLFDYISGIGMVAVLPIAGMLIYGIGMNFFNQAGPGSITASGMYGVELAPTKIRSQIQSYTVAAGRSGAALSSFVFPALFLVLGESFAFYYLGGLAIAAAVVTLVFIPETKGALEKSSNELNEMNDITVAGSK